MRQQTTSCQIPTYQQQRKAVWLTNTGPVSLKNLNYLFQLQDCLAGCDQRTSRLAHRHNPYDGKAVQIHHSTMTKEKQPDLKSHSHTAVGKDLWPTGKSAKYCGILSSCWFPCLTPPPPKKKISMHTEKSGGWCKVKKLTFSRVIFFNSKV